jgi:hypothetical protein
MPRFLAESHVSGSPTAFDDACDHARLVATAGVGVSYVHTTFLPGDRLVLHLFDAPSVAALDAAGRDAGLRFERIVEATEDTADERKETGK